MAFIKGTKFSSDTFWYIPEKDMMRARESKEKVSLSLFYTPKGDLRKIINTSRCQQSKQREPPLSIIQHQEKVNRNLPM